MYRFIENELKKWRESKKPNPILLRGARQVGKTYIVEKFGTENFEEYIYINFEFNSEYKQIFSNPDPQKIANKIFQEFGKKLVVHKTLLFLDEIQDCPEAIIAMRYFYENYPGLHIIGAGSLLEFLLNSGKISIPVGRIDFLFLYPLTFYEFLIAKYNGNTNILTEIKAMNLLNPLDDFTHKKLLSEVKKYFYLGGMPAVLNQYFTEEDQLGEKPESVDKELGKIIYSYKKDFGKYANLAIHKYLDSVFVNSVKQIGEKFKYSKVDKEMNSQEIKRAYELLLDVGVLMKIKRASAAGLPLEASASGKHFKTIYLDVGLACKLLGTDREIIAEILSDQDLNSLAQGAISEQFVGQELLNLKPVYEETKLYYWERDAKSSSAEVDYLISHKGKLYPIEVKSGTTGRLKSMHLLMGEYEIPFGIRISQKKLEFENKILTVPFYAIQEIPRLINEYLVLHKTIYSTI